MLTVFLINCHITLWFVLLCSGQEGESVSVLSDVVKQGSLNDFKNLEIGIVFLYSFDEHNQAFLKLIKVFCHLPCFDFVF